MTSEVTATIKESKNHDAAWLVFRGTPAEVIADIAEAFGWNKGEADGFALVDVVTKAKNEFQAGGLVSVNLGGTPAKASSVAADGSEPAGPPWGTDGDSSPAQEPAQEDPNLAHLTALEKCETVTEVKLYWAANQDAFADEKLMAAYMARGKALKEAGKL